MKAILLAAGFSTRLYPLTKDKPKALLRLAEHPILTHLIERLADHQVVDEIVVVTNQRYEASLCTWKKNLCQQRGETALPPIDIVSNNSTSEENKPGAVADLDLGLRHLSAPDDFMVLAGDQYFDYDLRFALDAFAASGEPVVVGARLNKVDITPRMGLAKVDKAGLLTAFEEKPDRIDSHWVVYAQYVMPRSVMPLVAQYLTLGYNPEYLGCFLEWLCTDQRVHVCETHGHVYPFETPEAYANLQLNLFEQD